MGIEVKDNLSNLTPHKKCTFFQNEWIKLSTNALCIWIFTIGLGFLNRQTQSKSN